MNGYNMGVDWPNVLSHAIVIIGFAAAFALGFMCGREYGK